MFKKNKGVIFGYKKLGPVNRFIFKLSIFATILTIAFFIITFLSSASKKGQDAAQNDRDKKHKEEMQYNKDIKKYLQKEALTPQKIKANYRKAKIFHDISIFYRNSGRKEEAAEALIFFKEIASKTNAYNAMAGAAIQASWEYRDIGNIAKAAELQYEAGDCYIMLKDFSEAKLWKKEAAKKYLKIGMEKRAEEIFDEIKNLEKNKSNH